MSQGDSSSVNVTSASATSSASGKISPPLDNVAGLPSYQVKLVHGNANSKLAQDIAQSDALKSYNCLEGAEVTSFADGEIKIQIDHNIRGSDMFIIQPVCPPDVNGHLMELLLLINTLKLSSARRITAVIPYYGYARQDRKTRSRVPISASAVATLIEAMGPDRVITVDLHCGQIQGFFKQVPVENLFTDPLYVSYIKDRFSPEELKRLTIVSPDAGGVARARRIADCLNLTSVCTILKRRVKANEIESMQLVGEVAGEICLIVDDIVDTAGTLCKASQLLMDQGAAEVHACITHGVLSGPALSRINSQDSLQSLVVTDTIPQHHKEPLCPKLKVLSVANLLAEAISRVHQERSLSALFRLD